MKIEGTKQVNGVKVFSETKARERAELGEKITAWMRERPHLEIVDKIVTQSSDSEFHCLTITFMFFDPHVEVRVSDPTAKNYGARVNGAHP